MHFRSEIWACNWAYMEFPRKITRLAGDDAAMFPAALYKKEHLADYEIWAKNIKSWKGHWYRDEVKPFTVHPKWLKDTGTALVTQALHEGFELIYVTGFLTDPVEMYGGKVLPDVNMEKWKMRWNDIRDEWGFDRIVFLEPALRDLLKAYG